MKNSIKQPYTYTGREYDRETGLYYYRVRYYDGEGGVFLSKDPIGFLGGQTNLYSYVSNAPTSWVDPWGLLSYLVSRPLQGKVGNYASHNFVITNAKYIGDPNATVYSYGNNNSGNVGRVDGSTTGFSAGTQLTDLAAWYALKNSKTACQDVSMINAPDAIVDTYSNALIENQDYAAFAGPFGANSNSAAQAIANRSAQDYVPTPGGYRVSPGAGSWQEIQFTIQILTSTP